jgi:hypothetical protein
VRLELVGGDQVGPERVGAVLPLEVAERQLALEPLDVPGRPVVEDRVADDPGRRVLGRQVPPVRPVDDPDLAFQVEQLGAGEALHVVEGADARVRVGEVEARRLVPARGDRVGGALLGSAGPSMCASNETESRIEAGRSGASSRTCATDGSGAARSAAAPASSSAPSPPRSISASTVSPAASLCSRSSGPSTPDRAASPWNE